MYVCSLNTSDEHVNRHNNELVDRNGNRSKAGNGPIIKSTTSSVPHKRAKSNMEESRDLKTAANIFATFLHDSNRVKMSKLRIFSCNGGSDVRHMCDSVHF